MGRGRAAPALPAAPWRGGAICASSRGQLEAGRFPELTFFPSRFLAMSVFSPKPGVRQVGGGQIGAMRCQCAGVSCPGLGRC